MSSSFGNNLHIQLFGQSHSEGLGVVMDGLPAGERLDLAAVQRMLARRAPGGPLASKRREPDEPEILSGLVDGLTCGAPLCAVFRNTDTRPQDYDKMRFKPRPSHADYPVFVKTNGANDARGGGHTSARLTAPLVFAGAVCAQLLEKRGIFVGAHIASVETVEDACFDPVGVTRAQLALPAGRDFPVLDEAAGAEMQRRIRAAMADGDSVGGTVECCVLGLPVGLGAPMFDGLENRIAAAVFAVPAVRGIEFGAGFAASRLRGSAHNDPFCYEDGAVRTRTNRHGGVLGGLASGMPLLFRAAFKPTPSIAQPQRTVDLATGQETELVIEGRHDPCVVPRAVPCVEAAAALAVYDLLLGENACTLCAQGKR